MTQKIVSIIGARPQFVKAGPLSKELRKQFIEILVHTGQHYDYGMSDIFFEELDIPKPDYNLGICGGTHGKMTGEMLKSIEEVLLMERPDAVIVYGDTNSTLAGSLAAVKRNIPVGHVEAGLRSYNRKMPEEINRILSDQISKWLFIPSEVAKQNLKKEGITEGVYIVGDIMCDVVISNSKRADEHSKIIDKLGLVKQKYFLATVHRPENTDYKDRLSEIFDIFASTAGKIIFPIHPRTKNKVQEYGIKYPDNILVVDPLGYLDMLQLMQNAEAILTDSGGIQKEAYYLNIPCITLRDESEWTETITAGWNFIVGADKEKFNTAFKELDKVKKKAHPSLYGDGKTAEKIVEVLKATL
jgi:UDP-N-acetylglucosamine 2-epimerase